MEGIESDPEAATAPLLPSWTALPLEPIAPPAELVGYLVGIPVDSRLRCAPGWAVTAISGDGGDSGSGHEHRERRRLPLSFNANRNGHRDSQYDHRSEAACALGDVKVTLAQALTATSGGIVNQIEAAAATADYAAAAAVASYTSFRDLHGSSRNLGGGGSYDGYLRIPTDAYRGSSDDNNEEEDGGSMRSRGSRQDGAVSGYDDNVMVRRIIFAVPDLGANRANPTFPVPPDRR